MSSETTYWRLDGTDNTLLVVQDHAVPRLYWCGEKLQDTILMSQLLAHDDAALAFGGMDSVTPLSLFPQASTGYTGSPALNGHRNGTAFAHCMHTVNVAQSDNCLTITLADDNAGLTAEISLSLDVGSDVARMTTTLTNTATTPFTVDWLASATLPMPNQYRECLTQHGRWGLENQSHRRNIAPGRIDISNLHGRTSHEHAPSLACGTAGFGNGGGDVMFAHLGWSGNFSLRVERLENSEISLQAGVLFLPGECILKPGEQLATPAVTFTRGHGMNQCTQRFHHHIRTSILPDWTRKARPIHANSWEALYFDHDLEALLPLIDAAASVGAERFVLDDGWFRHRRSDNAGLGDWYVDQSVYPDGLHPVVSRVRQHGMQFGLWFEPEMVNPDSDLYRNHPEWTLHLAHVNTPLARNQLVLDLARDEVADYLFERITSLVHEYAIDYIKWDMNRDLVLAGDGSHARSAAQPTALYRLLERILDVCPKLEIETCASGGARVDLAILEHTGRVWTSDNIDPIERASIQQGFLRFMPPEIMGAHVGHKTAHLTGRVTSLHTRAIIALQGQFGFELDARKLDAHDVITLLHYTQLYKSNRDWLANSCYWQLTTYSKTLIACGYFFAPGRVNLIGEYTDFTGGLVFPCGINKGTTLLIRRTYNQQYRFASTNFDLMAQLDQSEIGQTYGDNWINYPLGVLDQFTRRGVSLDGFDCLYSGNVPNGAGLSSSASIEVVTAFALNELLKTELSLLELVSISQSAENDFVGMQCGIMDQFAVAFAQAGHAMMLDCHTVEHRQVPLNLNGLSIIVTNTNQRRELNESAYNSRVRECQRALELLAPVTGISYLGQLQPEQF